jgi:adiponectin receptor
MDYLGIAGLIFGSFFSVLYYLFYCDRFYMKLYQYTMAALCTLTAAIATHPTFDLNEYKHIRFAVFGTTCLFALVPYSDILIRFWRGSAMWLNIHYYVLSSVAIYTLGGVMFANKFPEKFLSRHEWKGDGRFDVWGASHQLWHVCVVAALTLHFYGLVDAVSDSREKQCILTE